LFDRFGANENDRERTGTDGRIDNVDHRWKSTSPHTTTTMNATITNTAAHRPPVLTSLRADFCARAAPLHFKTDVDAVDPHPFIAHAVGIPPSVDGASA